MAKSFEEWLLVREQMTDNNQPKPGQPPSKVTQAATKAAATALRSGKPPAPGEDPAKVVKDASKDAAAETLETDPDATLQDVEVAAKLASRMAEKQPGQPQTQMMKKGMKKK